MSNRNYNYEKVPINQFPNLEKELDNFLEIKAPKKQKETSWFARFIRYILRPIRFLLRQLFVFTKWLWKCIVHAVHVVFLIPEKDLSNTKNIHNVLLLRGDWGLGKTYLVNTYFENSTEAHLRYKPVFVDLFGVSSLDELNKKIVKSISYSKKQQKERSVRIYAKATLDNKLTGLSASLEIGVVLSRKIERVRAYNLFVEQENAIYKKHKYRFIKEPVIILDDIERKDKRLSLQSIIGFVDIFKKKNVKVILIANLNQLELEEKEMYHLLDRAVDRTIYIHDIKESIGSFVELFQKENQGSTIYLPAHKAKEYLTSGLTSNLRTIKRFCEFLTELKKENYTYADRALLNIALLCIICQCEGKYDYDELIFKKTEEKRRATAFLPRSNGEHEKTYNELYDETNASYSHLKKNRFETFYLLVESFIKQFEIRDDQVKRVVQHIYDCIERNSIGLINKLKIRFKKCALKNTGESYSFPYNVNVEGPYSKFQLKIKEFSNMLDDEDESKFYLFLKFANYIHNCFLSSGAISKEKAKKAIGEVLDKYIELAVDEFLNNDWKYDIYFSKPSDPNIASNKYSIFGITSLLVKKIVVFINSKYFTYGIENTIKLIRNMSSMSEDCYFFEECLSKIDSHVLRSLVIASDHVLIEELITSASISNVFCEKVKPVFQKALNENDLAPAVTLKLKQSFLKLTKQK